MKRYRSTLAATGLALIVVGFGLRFLPGQGGRPAPDERPRDVAAQVQNVRPDLGNRPEQQKGKHDKSEAFDPENAEPSSRALKDQPEKGTFEGFDFARDPLDAKKPKQSPHELLKMDKEMKPKVMALQQKVLEARYNLKPRLDPQAKMSRGKPLCVGPTARLPEGLSFEKLAELGPD